MKAAYYCMDNPKHQMFKANVDGACCPECKGLVNVTQVSVGQYYELPTYDELRKKFNTKPKKQKGININLLFDDKQTLKLRTIAKHLETLAEALDNIDIADDELPTRPECSD